MIPIKALLPEVEQNFTSRLAQRMESLETKDRQTLVAWLNAQATILRNTAVQMFCDYCEDTARKCERIVNIAYEFNHDKYRVLPKGEHPDIPTDPIERYQYVTEVFLKERNRVRQELDEACRERDDAREELNGLLRKIEMLKTEADAPDYKTRESFKAYRELVELAKKEKNPIVKAQMVRSAGLIVSTANGLEAFVQQKEDDK